MRPALGETVVITAIKNANSVVNLKVGDTLTVGDPGPFLADMPHDREGFVWLNNDNQSKCGWAKWAYPETRAEARLEIPKVGQVIEITEVTSTAGGIYPDEQLTVGQVSPEPNSKGFVWVSDAPPDLSYHAFRYGWVKWKPVKPDTDRAPATDTGLRARCTRQRRELRRLSKQNRELRLERDNSQYALENTLEALVLAHRGKRVAEMRAE